MIGAIDLYSATSPCWPVLSCIDYYFYNQPLRRDSCKSSSSSLLGTAGKSFVSRFEKATQPCGSELKYVIVLNDSILPIIEVAQDNTEQSQDKVVEHAITFIDCLNPIRERLALSITQMAELFGVSRKSIYDWYEGIEPRTNTTTRIEILKQALDDIPSEVDLKRLKVVWNIPVSGQSFRAVYNNDKLENGSLLTELKTKLHELSPNLVKKSTLLRKTTAQLGEAQLTEFDRHADFS